MDDPDQEVPLVEMTRDEVLAGLRAGQVLCIERRDSPVLPVVHELASEGLVTLNLVQVEEQSSVLEVRLTEEDA
jgi:hypothetical protein